MTTIRFRLCALASTLTWAATAVSAQSPLLDCSANSLVPGRVALTWPAVPTPGSLTSSAATLVDLRMTSRAQQALDFELVGHMVAGGERSELALASGTVAPLGSVTLAVPLDGFGIGIASLRFSGSLFVEARVVATDATLLDRAFSPSIFFHRDSDGTVHVYGRDARTMFFNSGDLYFSIYPTLPPPEVQGIFDGGAGEGSRSQDTGPPQLSSGGSSRTPLQPTIVNPPYWEFCMRWVYQSIDSGFGEDYYAAGSLMKARGMKVTVNHANWALPKTFYASEDNGCFAFTAAENTGFVVTVFAEACLGQNDNLTVKAFPTKAQAQSNPNNPPQWVFAANPGGQPRRVYYQNEASEESNLMAFGSFVLHWIDVATQPGLAGPETMFLASDNPGCSGGGSCQDGNYVLVKSGDTNRKFLVGHEVGHWIHRQWTGDDMGYFNDSWSANSGDADCAFLGVGSHAMRSKERSAGGFIEGFAHYLSALAWNSHNQSGGIFKYYKEVTDAAYDDLEADNWKVDLDGIGANPLGGVTNWMENMCFVSDGHSVEMDWLRMYWDYRTNSGTKPTHFQIFEHIQYTRDVNPWNNSLTVYDRLSETIDDAGLGQATLASRFESLAEANGVAQ